MFPNPQAAIPLPPRPSLEQYRKLAKDLVKACASGEPDAIGHWAERWLASLARALGVPASDLPGSRMRYEAGMVEEFATRKLSGGGRKCVLADAQYVLASAHGFESWPRLAAHLDALAHAGTEVADFEAAADAIVTGDEATLRRLLAAQPRLAQARSTREHGATLLHYVSANGVEGYRQKTPANAVRMAQLLLDAGAAPDAETDVYGGRCTTLLLVATSVHPFLAGVQNPLMQLLIDRGARVEHPPGPDNRGRGVVMECLANGRGEAAVFLAERGARLDLAGAAGIGRVEVVKSFFDGEGRPKAGVTKKLLEEAFLYACGWNRIDVVEFLLERGVDSATSGSDGQSALHWAGMGGHLETIQLLLKRGAPLEGRNQYNGTVLGQTLWSAAHDSDPDGYIPALEALIAAGARLAARHPPVSAGVDALLARHGSVADPEDYWFGEGPRRRKS